MANKVKSKLKQVGLYSALYMILNSCLRRLDMTQVARFFHWRYSIPVKDDIVAENRAKNLSEK